MARAAGWRRLRPFVRPAFLLLASLVIGVFVVRFVGAVDWTAVWAGVRRLGPAQVVVLVVLLLLRQVLTAVPLARFVPGLTLGRSVQNDLTANLVGTFAPPPADVVLRVSMFRSWGIDPVDGMAGVTLNMLTFYSVRFLAPALGLVALSAHGLETGQIAAAAVSAAVATVILLGLVLVLQGDGLARVLGRLAGRVAARFRSSVEPHRWADAVVAFRGRMASTVRTGLAWSMVALVGMVLTDGVVLLAALRFVGVGAAQLPAEQVIGTFLVAYPLTLLPLAGLGALDAALIAAFTEIAGLSWESEIVAGLVVWRTVTILGALALGAVTGLLWRRAARQSGLAYDGGVDGTGTIPS